jgi:hypothetical protein
MTRVMERSLAKGVAVGALLSLPIWVIGLLNGRSAVEIAIYAGVVTTTFAVVAPLPRAQKRWRRGILIGIVSGLCFVCIDLQWSSYDARRAVTSFVVFGTMMGLVLSRDRQLSP